MATQDTVTLVRSAMRMLLRVASVALATELRASCHRDDTYEAPGKPACAWDDAEAREALIDALARDANAILATLEGPALDAEVQQAAQLVATGVGQDFEQTEAGTFRGAWRPPV